MIKLAMAAVIPKRSIEYFGLVGEGIFFSATVSAHFALCFFEGIFNIAAPRDQSRGELNREKMSTAMGRSSYAIRPSESALMTMRS